MTDIPNWSTLPDDMYVIRARCPDGVVYDATMCSVPMAIGPEVRYVSASKYEQALRERDEARAKALEDVRRMIFVEISPQPVAEGDWGNEAVEMAQYLAANVALMKDRAP